MPCSCQCSILSNAMCKTFKMERNKVLKKTHLLLFLCMCVETCCQTIRTQYYLDDKIWGEFIPSSSYFLLLCRALVSQGCHNQVPQAGLLETTGIYSLTPWEAGGLKSRSWQGRFLLRETLLLASLPASGGYWQSLPFLGLQRHYSNLCICLYTAFFPACPRVRIFFF